MKLTKTIRVVVLGLVWLAGVPAAPAQEMITIPRARLEELERKEKELDRMKGELSTAKTETVRLKKEKEEAVAKAAAVIAAAPPEVVIQHVTPVLATLPPLAKGETVDALDLAGHYRADAAAADARYRKKVFKVKGEIVGFDKPLVTRNYHVHLRAADRLMRVVCAVVPPEKFSAVFTTKNGTVLTGVLKNGARIQLARLGDTVVVEGRCSGLDGQAVEMSGGVLLAAP